MAAACLDYSLSGDFARSLFGLRAEHKIHDQQACRSSVWTPRRALLSCGLDPPRPRHSHDSVSPPSGDRSNRTTAGTTTVATQPPARRLTGRETVRTPSNRGSPGGSSPSVRSLTHRYEAGVTDDHSPRAPLYSPRLVLIVQGTKRSSTHSTQFPIEEDQALGSSGNAKGLAGIQLQQRLLAGLPKPLACLKMVEPFSAFASAKQLSRIPAGPRRTRLCDDRAMPRIPLHIDHANPPAQERLHTLHQLLPEWLSVHSHGAEHWVSYPDGLRATKSEDAIRTVLAAGQVRGITLADQHSPTHQL
jgi:hypothetical protein